MLQHIHNQVPDPDWGREGELTGWGSAAPTAAWPPTPAWGFRVAKAETRPKKWVHRETQQYYLIPLVI